MMQRLTLAGWTIFAFGLMAAALGLAALFYPDILLLQLGFDTVPAAARAPGDYTPVFLIASAVASLNMGVYYLFAAFTDLRIFFKATVPFRCLTFLIFTTLIITGAAPVNFLKVALWELIGALATGLALFYEHRNRSR